MITLAPKPSTYQASDVRQTPTSISPNVARLRSIGPNVVRVDLSAHVNLSSSNDLHDLMNELLDEWQGYTLIVSFSDVMHVDWTGLGVLISGLQRFRRAGSAVSVACDDFVHRSMLESSDIEIIRECRVDRSNLVDPFGTALALDGLRRAKRQHFFSDPLRDRSMASYPFFHVMCLTASSDGLNYGGVGNVTTVEHPTPL